MIDTRISSLKSLKASLDAGRLSRSNFNDLLTKWHKQGNDFHAADVFPIRAASLLEVFVRGWVRTVVNHSKVFAERGIPLLVSFKPDYSFLIEIKEETITYGDIVAHAISVSTTSNVITTIERLSEKQLARALPSVLDRWEVEVMQKPSTPILTDYDSTISNVAALLSVRHRIAHESASLSADELKALPIWLKALADFANALDWFLTDLLYGPVPLTQTDMNVDAYKHFEEAEAAMQAVLEKLYRLLQNDHRALKLVKTSQRAWERYRQVQMYCAHDPVGGGTIGPLLRSGEGVTLTKSRTESLNRHIAFSGLLSLP